MSYVIGTTITLIGTASGGTPASPVRAHVKRQSGTVDTVTLTLDEASGSYLGSYTAAEVGRHTWTVDTGAPASVRNGTPFEVIARAATPA